MVCIAANEWKLTQLKFLAITAVCEPGQNFISTTHLYGGTYNQFRVYLAKFNIHVKFIQGEDPAAIAAAIDSDTRAIYMETMGNPQFNVPDIAAVSAVAHEARVPVIVDNTFGMGGFVCKPFSLGADIITHSTTKWIGGHGTSMGGIVIDGGKFNWSATPGKFIGLTEPSEGYHGMRFHETYGAKALCMKVRMDGMRDLGPCMSPFNAWLFLQGLETLSLRGERHCANALAFAHWLDKHPDVAWVNYPGLPSHPDHALAKRTFTGGFGGVLTFGVAGDIDKAAAVVDGLNLCSHVANVGDAKTLTLHPWRSTHQQIPDSEKIEGGVTPDMIRVSVGLEHVDDVIADFEQAFEKAGLMRAQGWVPNWKKKGVDGWKDGTIYKPAPETAGLKVPESGDDFEAMVNKVPRTAGGGDVVDTNETHGSNGHYEVNGARDLWN